MSTRIRILIPNADLDLDSTSDPATDPMRIRIRVQSTGSTSIPQQEYSFSNISLLIPLFGSALLREAKRRRRDGYRRGSADLSGSSAQRYRSQILLRGHFSHQVPHSTGNLIFFCKLSIYFSMLFHFNFFDFKADSEALHRLWMTSLQQSISSAFHEVRFQVCLLSCAKSILHPSFPC